MVSIKGLLNTILTTENAYIAFSLKLYGKEKSIRFRNGSALIVSWSDYCRVRDFLSNKECADCVVLGQGATFSVKGKGVNLIAPSESLASTLFNIRKLRVAGYTIFQRKELYVVEGHGVKLVSDLDTLQPIEEMLADKAYNCDCQGKVVLDVGAFHGESAVFFSMNGAKKVILYEPVKAHQQSIEQNLSLNHVNAEIHMEGIGEKDGKQTIFYDKTDYNFGSTIKGSNQIEIETRNVTDVIVNSNANVAKFDCEGAEETLVMVADEVLRCIDLFIIEIHGEGRRKLLLQKFAEAGFIIAKDIKYSDALCVMHFRRAEASLGNRNGRRGNGT